MLDVSYQCDIGSFVKHRTHVDRSHSQGKTSIEVRLRVARCVVQWTRGLSTVHSGNGILRKNRGKYAMESAIDLEGE